MRRPALFVDKDGTLVDNVPYNVDPARIRFASGAIEALQRLHARGYVVIVVSNQAGVAFGRFQERALGAVEEALRKRLASADVMLTAMYWCPHHPDGTVARYRVQCSCRKPLPGMLHRAAQEHELDLESSWMVGDILDDVEAGRRARCRTVLLDNGHETQWQISHLRLPHCVAPDMARAADAILTADSAVVANLDRARVS